MWKNRQAASDGYVTGFEPAINFPNKRSFEKSKGRVATLQPGESRLVRDRLYRARHAESVADAEKAVAALQAGTEPEILGKPNPQWSAL